MQPIKEVQEGNITHNTYIQRKEEIQQILQMLKFVFLCKGYYALYYCCNFFVFEIISK